MGEQFNLFGEPPEPAPAPKPEPVRQALRIQYFDLETQKSADDVGGWGNSHQMGLAVGVVYDSVDRDYSVYLEKDAEALIQKLKTADLVVGFNVKGFDYVVMQPYANKFGIDLQEIPTHDMLLDIQRKLNHRLPLDNLAKCNLGETKSADGLQSLQWYKEGKIDLIVEYCKQDVKVTRDVFLFGEKNGYVDYDTRSGKRQRLNVEWDSGKLAKANRR